MGSHIANMTNKDIDKLIQINYKLLINQNYFYILAYALIFLYTARFYLQIILKYNIPNKYNNKIYYCF